MLPLELHFLYTSTIIYQLQLKIVIESYIALIVTARIVAITHQFLSLESRNGKYAQTRGVHPQPHSSQWVKPELTGFGFGFG
jgi:hypothetical protein